MRSSAKNGMLRSLFTNNQQHKLLIKQVRLLLSQFSRFSSSLQTPNSSKSPPSSTTQRNRTHKDFSSIQFTGIAKSVISKCSHFWDSNRGETCTSLSLQDYLLRLSSVSPETIRRFWRVTVLKPEDVVEILLGFECNTGKNEVELKKVEFLWGIFNLASARSRDFEHVPQSWKIMARMLVSVGMFSEAERALSSLDNRGILLDCTEIFSNLIEGYLGRFQLKRAISIYDRMRLQGLVPTLSCYLTLLKCLVQVGETQLAYGMYLDMEEMGLGRNGAEMGIYEKIVRLLCKDGRLQEARNLVKRVLGFGIEPNSSCLNAMVGGYCKKKDYGDILSLFTELRCTPNALVSNRIIHSLCKHFGAERAESFMKQLRLLDFVPDEKTLGVLIGWSCREGKLKNAFMYFSEILSRSLQPQIYSYNALMCGLLKVRMFKHAGDILDEMKAGGVMPEFSTFRILLAGYCKARQFNRVKAIVGEMADHGLIQLSSSDDPLCIAFTILGLNPSSVKVKRDNDKGFCKTEFFDDLGNGLFLDTDMNEYEKTMVKVLYDGMVPDFNSLILEYCGDGDIKGAVMMIDEMAQWGQELSSYGFSTLVKGLCASSRSIKAVSSLLEKMSESYNLEGEILNKLVQTYCKKGFTSRAKFVFEEMLLRHLRIENETYTYLLKGLCKTRDFFGLRRFWHRARKYNWSFTLNESQDILGYLSQQKLLNEALELFEVMLSCSHNQSDVFHVFLQNLCSGGLTFTAQILVEEALKRGSLVDHMAYNKIVIGFCKEKKFSDAICILDTLLAKNLPVSLDVSEQLIPQLCKAGKFEKAVALKDVCSRESPSFSAAVYRALLSGFCRSAKVGEAVNLLQEMLVEGLTPDGEEYNMLVEGYCLAKNLTKVLELLGLMIRRNLTISIASYRNLVHLMCVNGRYKLAWGLKELMLVQSSLSILIRYNIFIYYLFSIRRTDLVKSLIDELQKKGVQFDEVTYNFIVHGFSRCKDFSSSMDYLKSMMSKELRPSNRCLREVIRGLCSKGKLMEALRLSQEMESRGWVHGVVIQSIVVDSLLRHGMLDEAVKFLDRMVAKGLIPDNANYDYLIKRFCQHGVPEKASDLFSIMLKKGKVPDSLSFDYLIQGFASGNEMETALDFHSEMLFRKLKPGITTWTTLVQRLCETGRAAEAETLLDSMVQRGETPSREMYCCLIIRYRSENDLSKASKLVRAMQVNGYEPDFETHWSLISHHHSRVNDDGKGDRRFLSKFLSQMGFSWKSSKAKTG